MATYVNNLRLKEIATGDESGTWGTSTNTNLELIGQALGYGTEAITTNADTHTTTIADGAADEGRALMLKYTGTLDSTCTITLGPNTVKKVWIIENATSGSQSIAVSQGSGNNVTIASGRTAVVYSDGAGSGAAIVDALTDLTVTDSFKIAGATPTLTIGDGDGEDTKILFDGNAQDFYVGLDDTADDLIIGLGSAVGTTPIISLTEAGAITLKGTVTTDDSPMALTLQTAETDLALNDVIGKIDFQAPDEAAGSDAGLVAAGIEAVSEGDFSATSNATKLSFKTAASEAAAEKMALSSAGNLTVTGTVTDVAGAIRAIPVNTEASTYSLVAGDVGKVINSGGTVTVPASIFSAGDVITIFNNTAGSLTITCSAITTAYKAGTDADVDSVTIDTRGVATILFITTTLCVISGDLG